MSDFDIKIEVDDQTPGETLKNNALLGELGPDLQQQVLKTELERLSNAQKVSASQDARSEALNARINALREMTEIRIAGRQESAAIRIEQLTQSSAIRTAERVALIQQRATERASAAQERAADQFAVKVGRSIASLNPAGLFKTIFTGFGESIGRVAFSQFQKVTKGESVDPGRYIGNFIGGVYNRASIPVSRAMGYNSPREMMDNMDDPLKAVDRYAVAFSKGNRTAVKATADMNLRGQEFLDFYFQNLQQAVKQEVDTATKEMLTSNQKRVLSAGMYLSQPYTEYRRALGLSQAQRRAAEIENPLSTKEVEQVQRVPEGGTLIVGNPGYTKHGVTAAESFGLNVRQTLGVDYLPLNREKQTQFIENGKLSEPLKDALHDKDVFQVVKTGLGVAASTNKQFSKAQGDQFAKQLEGVKDGTDLINILESSLKNMAGSMKGKKPDEFKAAILSLLERVVVGTNLDLPEQIAQIKQIQELRPDVKLRYMGYSGASAHVRDIEQTTGVKGISMGSIINEDRGHPNIMGSEDSIAGALGDSQGYLKNTQRFDNAGQRHKAGFYFDKKEVVDYLHKELGLEHPATYMSEGQEDANFHIAAVLKDALSKAGEVIKPDANKTPTFILSTAKKSLNAIPSIVPRELAENLNNPHLNELTDRLYSVRDRASAAIESVPSKPTAADLQLLPKEEQDKLLADYNSIAQAAVQEIRDAFNGIDQAVEQYIMRSHIPSTYEKPQKQETAITTVSETEESNRALDTVKDIFENVKSSTGTVAGNLHDHVLGKINETLAVSPDGVVDPWFKPKESLSEVTPHDYKTLAARGLNLEDAKSLDQAVIAIAKTGLAKAGEDIITTAKSAHNLVQSLRGIEEPANVANKAILALRDTIVGLGQFSGRVYTAISSGQDQKALPGSDSAQSTQASEADLRDAFNATYSEISGQAEISIKELLDRIKAKLDTKTVEITKGYFQSVENVLNERHPSGIIPLTDNPEPLPNLNTLKAARKRELTLAFTPEDRNLLEYSERSALPGNTAKLELPGSSGRLALPESTQSHTNYFESLKRAELNQIASRGGIVGASGISRSNLLNKLRELNPEHQNLLVQSQQNPVSLPSYVTEYVKETARDVRSSGDMINAKALVSYIRNIKLRHIPTQSETKSLNNIKSEMEKLVKGSENESLHGFDVEDSATSNPMFRALLRDTKKAVSKDSNVDLNKTKVYIDPSLKGSGEATRTSEGFIVRLKSDTASIETITHELRHIAQLSNPKLDLMTRKDVTPGQFNRVKDSIDRSVTHYQQLNPAATTEKVDHVRKLETDAYLYAQKFAENTLGNNRRLNQDINNLASFEPANRSVSDSKPRVNETDLLIENVRRAKPLVLRKDSSVSVAGSGSTEGVEFLNLADNLRKAVTNPFKSLFPDVNAELNKLKASLKDNRAQDNPKLYQKATSTLKGLSDTGVDTSNVNKIQALNAEYEKYYYLRDVADRKVSGNLTTQEALIDGMQGKLQPLIAHFERLSGVKFTGNLAQFAADLAGVAAASAATVGIPLLLASIAKNSVDAALGLDQFSIQMRAIGESDSGIDKLNQKITSMGVNINAARELYTGLKQGVIGGNNESQFDSIYSDALATFKGRGLSAEQQKLVSLGLVQALSKGGSLQSQEYRLQIGGSLPGTPQIAQAATGLDPGAFARRMARGEIQADEFIPKFLAAGRAGFPDKGDSATEKLNRLESSKQIFQENTGKLPLAALATSADLATTALEFLNKNSTLVSITFSALLLRSLFSVFNMLRALWIQYAQTVIAQNMMSASTTVLGYTMRTTATIVGNFMKSLIVPAVIVGSIWALYEGFKSIGATASGIKDLADRMGELNKKIRERNGLTQDKPRVPDRPGSELNGIQAENPMNKLRDYFTKEVLVRIEEFNATIISDKPEDQRDESEKRYLARYNDPKRRIPINVQAKEELDNSIKETQGIANTALSAAAAIKTGVSQTTPQDVKEYQASDVKEQVLKTKVSIASAEGNTQEVGNLNRQLSDLQQNRTDNVKKIFSNQSNLSATATTLKATIDNIEGQIKEQPAKAEPYKKTLEDLKEAYKRINNEITEMGKRFDPSILALSKFKSGTQELQAFFEKRAQDREIFRANQTVAADPRRGSQGQTLAQLQNDSVNITDLSIQIKDLKTYRVEFLKKIAALDPKTKATLETALEAPLAQASTADLSRVLADVDKYGINKQQEGILTGLKDLQSKKVESAQKQSELNIAQSAYAKAQIDYNNQLSDYYLQRQRALNDEAVQIGRFLRDAQRQVTDAVLESQSINLSTLTTKWKNDLSKAVIGSTDTLVTSLSSALTNAIDATKSAAENRIQGSKLYTELSRSIQNVQESYDDKNLQIDRSQQDRNISDRNEFGGNKGTRSEQTVSFIPRERDAANLVLTALQESTGTKNQLDVAVSIFNRLASGSHGSNLTDVVFEPSQYEPNFGKVPANSLKEAVTRLSVKWKAPIEDVVKEVHNLLSALNNPGMVQDSVKFVGGRTDFKGTSQLRHRHAEDPYRGTNGANFFHGETSQNVVQKAINSINDFSKPFTPQELQQRQSYVTKPGVYPGSDGSVGNVAVDPKLYAVLENRVKAQIAQNSQNTETTRIASQAALTNYVRMSGEEILKRVQEFRSKSIDLGEKIRGSSGYQDTDYNQYIRGKNDNTTQIESLNQQATNLEKYDIPAMENVVKQLQQFAQSNPGVIKPEVIEAANKSLATMNKQVAEAKTSIGEFALISGDIPLLRNLEQRLLGIQSNIIGAKNLYSDLFRSTIALKGNQELFDTDKQIEDVKDKFRMQRLTLPVEIELEKTKRDSALTNSTDPSLTQAGRDAYAKEAESIQLFIDAKNKALEFASNPNNEIIAGNAIRRRATLDQRNSSIDFRNQIGTQTADALASPKLAYSFNQADIRNAPARVQINEDTERQLQQLNEMEYVLKQSGVDTQALRDQIINLGKLRLDGLISSAEEYGKKISDGVSNALVDATLKLADPKANILDIFKSLGADIAGVFKQVFSDIAKEMLSMAIKKPFISMFSSLLSGLGGASKQGGSGIGGLFSTLIGGAISGFGGGAGLDFSNTIPTGLSFSQGGIVPHYAEGGIIGDALRREGSGARVVVAHIGERMLSAKTGDAQNFDKLVRSGIWDQFKQSNYADGGTVGGSQLSSSYHSQSKNYMQSTYITNMHITTPNPDSFRATRTQIESDKARDLQTSDHKYRSY